MFESFSCVYLINSIWLWHNNEIICFRTFDWKHNTQIYSKFVFKSIFFPFKSHSGLETYIVLRLNLVPWTHGSWLTTAYNSSFKCSDSSGLRGHCSNMSVPCKEAHVCIHAFKKWIIWNRKSRGPLLRTLSQSGWQWRVCAARGNRRTWEKAAPLDTTLSSIPTWTLFFIALFFIFVSLVFLLLLLCCCISSYFILFSLWNIINSYIRGTHWQAQQWCTVESLKS